MDVLVSSSRNDEVDVDEARDKPKNGLRKTSFAQRFFDALLRTSDGNNNDSFAEKRQTSEPRAKISNEGPGEGESMTVAFSFNAL